MSLRTVSLILFALMLSILLSAMAGFHWVTERTLVDEELLAQSQMQLSSLQKFSCAVHRYTKEFTDTVTLGDQEMGELSSARNRADAALGDIFKNNEKEQSISFYGGKESAFDEEEKEQQLYVDLKKAYDRLHNTIQMAVVQEQQEELADRRIEVIRQVETEFDDGLVELIDQLSENEWEQVHRRQRAVLEGARLGEHIAIAALALALVVLAVGFFLLKRSLGRQASWSA